MNGDRLSGHQGRILCISESDRWIVTGSEDRTIRIWEKKPHSEVFHGEERLISPALALGKHKTAVTIVQFTLSGKVVAVAGNRVHIWDLLTRKCTCIIEAHEEPVEEVCQLSNGYFLTAGGEMLRMWNIEKQKMLFEMGPAPGVKICLECSDGSLLTAGDDCDIRRWTMEELENEPISILNGHTGNITSLLQLHDSKIASTSEDTTIRIWEGDMCVAIFEQHSLPVRSIIQNTQGQLVSGGDQDQIHIWEPSTAKVLHSISCPSGVKKLMDCSQTGIFISQSPDHVLRLWDMTSSDPLEELEIESSQVTLLSDCSIISGASRVWFPTLLVKTDNATALEPLLHKPSFSIKKLSEFFEVDDLSEFFLQQQKLKVAKLVKSHEQQLQGAASRVRSPFRPTGDIFPCSGALTQFIKFPKSFIFLHGDSWSQKPCVGFVFYDQIWGGNRKRTSAGVANICIYTIDTVRNSPRYDPSRTLIANAVALAFDFEPDPSSLIYGFTLESMNKRIELNDDDLCQNFYYDSGGSEEVKIEFPRVLRVQVEFFLHSYFVQGIKPDRRVPYSVVKATENSTCWQIYSSQLQSLGRLNLYSETFGRVELFQGEEFGKKLDNLEKENLALREEVSQLKQMLAKVPRGSRSAEADAKGEYMRQTLKFPPGKLGMTFDLFSGKIVRVVDGGVAETMGVKPGWVLVTINATPFSKERLLNMDFKISNKLAFDIPQFSRRKSSMGKRQPGAFQNQDEFFDADKMMEKRIAMLENEVKIARRQSFDIIKQGIQIKNKLDSHEAIVENKVQKLIEQSVQSPVAAENENAKANPSEEIIKEVQEVVDTKHVNLMQDIEELQMENSKLRASMDTLHKENLDSKQRFALLRNQLEKAKQSGSTSPIAAQDIEKHADRFFRQKSVHFEENLESIVKDGEALQEYVEATNTNVQEDIISLQLQNERLRTMVQSTQQDGLHQKAQIQVVRTQVEKLRDQIERIEKATRGLSISGAMGMANGSSGAGANGDYEVVKEKVVKLEQNYQTLQDSFNLFESGLQEEMNTQINDVEYVQKRLDLLDANLTQDVHRLSVDYSEMVSKNDKVSLEARSAEQKSRLIRDQVQSSKEQHKAFQDQMKSVLFTLKRQVDTINETLDRYDDRESELEEFVQATEERHKTLSMSSDELKDQLKSIRNELSSPRIENALSMEKMDSWEKLVEENNSFSKQIEARVEERMIQMEAALEQKFTDMFNSMMVQKEGFGGGAIQEPDEPAKDQTLLQ